MRLTREQKKEYAKIAQRHTEEQSEKFPDEIRRSIENSFVVSEAENKKPGETTDIIVELLDSVSAVVKYAPEGKVCVLNFASYTSAGGRFMEGNFAQEEALCHESFLYNVLSSEEFKDFYKFNDLNKNKGLYRNRALYSKDVYFRDGIPADVVTCAAANYRTLERYKTGTKEENEEIMKERIEFLLNVISNFDADIVILGAWGCGVFRQDPCFISEEFRKALKTHKFKKAVFAIKDEKTYEKFL